MILLGGPALPCGCATVLGGRSFVPDFALGVISSAALRAGLWEEGISIEAL